ncbi:MAG TPA: serine/threonine-protein kinase, partial [Ktedonobacteraceae bacterium]|nr:serine/threonine-protein kinase [Ktedonobacteraceae bacterium]
MKPSLWFCASCGAANEDEDHTCFACSQERAEQGDESEHLLHERYRLLTPVGTGGFAVVYKAVDTLEADALVAVKQINLRKLTAQQTIEATDAFHRELQVLSPLKHPHLPRIHEHFTDANHWYLVMDFVEGETLERYLERSARDSRSGRAGLPLDEVLSIGLQLCSVLDYLHTRQPPVIFRDLKPSNILRTERGHLFLVDFGIARYFKPGQTKDTIPFGSPGYAAPEQYGKAQTTARADIYSLGAVLHHLLTGDDPSETPFYFAPLRLYGSDELNKLEALIMRMVQMDASKRPESIKMVQEELQQLSLAEGSRERIWYPPPGQAPLPAGSQTWQTINYGSGQLQMQQQQQSNVPFPVGRRTFVKLAIGASMVLVAGSFIASLQRPGFRSSPGSGYYNGWDGRHRDDGDADDRSMNAQAFQVASAALSSTGKNIAFARSDGSVQISQLDVSNGTQQPVFVYQIHSPRSVTAMAWSPQGDKIALSFSGEGVTVGAIEIWDAVNGKNIATYQKHHSSVNALAWSPDGKYIASASLDILANVWDASNGKAIFAFPNPQGSGDNQNLMNVVAWSPDSKNLAYTHGSNILRVFNVQNSSGVSNTAGQTDLIAMAAWSPDGQYIASASNTMVQVWDATKGTLISTLAAPLDPVLTWLSDQMHLATATSDGKVQVWNPFTELLRTATRGLRAQSRHLAGCQIPT